MPDQSHLDSRYFVDGRVYNCPFCNRRNVAYVVSATFRFDWTDAKPCFGYITRCSSCENESMHLTFAEVETQYIGNVRNEPTFRFEIDDGDCVLDETFFYSVPTSFFALDDRIPRVLRQLLTEAEGCLKSNFLTGASACARKLVYELGVLHKATGENYEDRIKSLKDLHPEVDPTFFDTLLTVQQVTSTKVHENAYDGWESRHLRLILLALSDVLHEMYVVPALRADRRAAVLALKQKLVPPKSESPSGGN
jgi:hypothetical protein